MTKILVILCLAMIIRLTPVCLAETIEPTSDNAIKNSANASVSLSKNPEQKSKVESKKNIFHFEVGGNYSKLNSGDVWKSLDMRLMYSGFNKFTPFASVSKQTRSTGSQLAYGLASYINVNPKFYMIAGISCAPVKDPNVILSPRLRLDVAGLLNVPKIKGLVFTLGETHLPKQNGNGADIIAVGTIYYYRKFVFGGAVNYNISQPGSVTSFSGQVGLTYGLQGKYYIGGGATMGRAAYQLANTNSPFEVRYRSRGLNFHFNKWMGKNWGINNRLDYGEIVWGESKLFGITTNVFFDF
jgi:YaiO family outer membrane protein